MANRFLSDYSEDSGSSESSEGEDDLWIDRVRENTINLSHSELDTDTFEANLTNLIADEKRKTCEKITNLLVTNNHLSTVPDIVSHLSNLTRLDFSNNHIKLVCDAITGLASLTHLYLRNNLITDNDLPKDMIGMRSLRTLNLSGNRLTCLPPQLLDISSLRNLFLGANNIKEVTSSINRLRKLRLLYLGGNELRVLPSEIGELPYMQVLLLSDNKLKKLPPSLCNLSRLQCLHLHKNKLMTLPHGLIHIRSLSELSLRDNPLVMRFIRDMEYQPASLLEMAARSIKAEQIPYNKDDLPRSLQKFLSMSHECVNPSCNGVYFDHRVEHVKFSDFCGKYKIPLLQYLCSPQCREQLPEYADCDLEDSDGEQATLRLKRVLLG
eukprot:GFUD01035778.1.p1 GENE.GFUD01035778.1~~GFUD01035778.1.p1  ORF type:complete len:398 (-),score=89.49 GFUD01035778.1:248-1390(-)